MLDEDAVVMWGNSPVLRVIILIGVVLLVISEESIELYALLEILNSLEASDVLKEIEISVNIDAGSDKSMPVDTLQLDVRVVLLELEVNGVAKVNVWPLDSMHVFSTHFELVEVEVFGEHFHFCF